MIVYVNGERQERPAPVRLSEVLGAAPGEPTPRGIAVAVDGTVVPRSRHAATELAEGARVEIVTAVQGG
ncbi:MAG: thiS [Friedmanniella sp.]|nr:thiS [Friedmanniella sp.]